MPDAYQEKRRMNEQTNERMNRRKNEKTTTKEGNARSSIGKSAANGLPASERSAKHNM